jgi:hypothetical protein
MIVGLLAAVGGSAGVATVGAVAWLVVRWRASAVVDHVAALALHECPAERRAEIVAASAKLAESLVAEGRLVGDLRRGRTAPLFGVVARGKRRTNE